MLALASAGCTVTATEASLTVDNQSSFALDDLRVAPTDNASWGPDLLEARLLPGDRITVDVSCGTYDVLVGNDAGQSCELDGLHLCFSEGVWAIDDTTLSTCGFE